MSKKQIEKIGVLNKFGVREKEILNQVIDYINSQEEEMHKRMDELKDIDFTKVTNESG